MQLLELIGYGPNTFGAHKKCVEIPEILTDISDFSAVGCFFFEIS
jgi:hypothetical protein